RGVGRLLHRQGPRQAGAGLRLFRGGAGTASGQAPPPGRGHCLCNAELRTALPVQSIGSIFPTNRRVPVSHAKQTSTKRRRSINAVPVLRAAGLSLSLASGASAAIGRPPADMLTP